VADTPPPPGDPELAALLRQAKELAAAAREAEERAEALRRLRDRAVIGILERHGMSTRRLGAHLGLTATQVSTIWRRTRPARAPGRRPPAPADTPAPEAAAPGQAGTAAEGAGRRDA
jgi:hypothetical protein